MTVKQKRGNSPRYDYLELPMAFDIETSSWEEHNEKLATMYCWQVSLFGYIFMGRTWDKFKSLINKLNKYYGLDKQKSIVCYVHNLSYEYEFMKHIFNFDEVFIINGKIAKARCKQGVEFRCSYLLTNKKLEDVAKDLVKYKVDKLVGDLDYSKIRTSETPLTEKEIGYCINDVRIITNYIVELLDKEKSLANIPLTKTGFVRRECKKLCMSDEPYKALRRSLKLNREIYDLNKKCYTGAYVHCNAVHSERLLHNVASYDFSSSYLKSLVAEKYPVTTPKKVAPQTQEELNNYVNNYCCLISINFTNIKLKSNVYFPLLSVSKCTTTKEVKTDNGRVVEAKFLMTNITDVDLKLLQKVYDWDYFTITDMYVSMKGYLPKVLVEFILDKYEKKTKLKGSDDIVNYMASKEDANSIYGMMCTDLALGENIDTAVTKWNSGKKGFLYPLWGTWCTAYARSDLYTGILATGVDLVYTDTDSLKIVNYEAHREYIEGFNSYITIKLERALNYHNIPLERIRPKDKPLGVWDFEGVSERFKALRSKAYLSQKKGEYNLTVSGLSKKEGIKYLQEVSSDPFEVFKDGLQVPAGRTGKLTYTQVDKEIQGTVVDYTGKEGAYHELSYVHMKPCSFELNFTDDYKLFCQLINSLIEV